MPAQVPSFLHVSASAAPLPGSRTPECKRRLECEKTWVREGRGLDSSLCVATNALRMGNAQEKEEMFPRALQALCLVLGTTR